MSVQLIPSGKERARVPPNSLSEKGVTGTQQERLPPQEAPPATGEEMQASRKVSGPPQYGLGSQLARGVVPWRIGDLESSCRGQITKENRTPGARDVRLESKAIAGHWPVHGPFSPSCCSLPEPGNSAPSSGHSADTKAAVPFLAFSPQGSVVPALTGC